MRCLLFHHVAGWGFVLCGSSELSEQLRDAGGESAMEPEPDEAMRVIAPLVDHDARYGRANRVKSLRCFPLAPSGPY
jgi:hypothetical protein